MTAENYAKRTFNITIMRPIFQIARFRIEAATRDEAIDFAREHELTLKESDWQGPFEKAVYEETENDSLQVFRRIPKETDPGESS